MNAPEQNSAIQTTAGDPVVPVSITYAAPARDIREPWSPAEF